jgi:hypothetical protein
LRQETVELLSGAPNAIVLKVSWRKFPGILLQGDTISICCSELDELKALVRTDLSDAEVIEEVRALIDGLSEQFSSLKAHYVRCLKTNDLKLPFSE